jgi:hypothetical protein
MLRGIKCVCLSLPAFAFAGVLGILNAQSSDVAHDAKWLTYKTLSQCENWNRCDGHFVFWNSVDGAAYWVNDRVWGGMHIRQITEDTVTIDRVGLPQGMTGTYTGTLKDGVIEGESVYTWPGHFPQPIRQHWIASADNARLAAFVAGHNGTMPAATAESALRLAPNPFAPHGFDDNGRMQMDTTLIHVSGMAVDRAGNFFLADDAAELATSPTSVEAGVKLSKPLHRILKVDAATGKTKTLVKGDDKKSDTIGEVFPDWGPRSVVLDGAGNLYSGNAERVYKISLQTGAVTWIAGKGFVEGALPGKHFDVPGRINATFFAGSRDLALDGSGNLLVAGTGVQRVDLKTGSASIVVGGVRDWHGTPDPPAPITKSFEELGKEPVDATQYFLNFDGRPYEFTADPAGNLYFADSSNEYGNPKGIAKVSGGKISYLTIPHGQLSKLDVDDTGKPLTKDAVDQGGTNSHGLAADAAGNIYFYEDRSIWRRDGASGSISRVGIMPSSYHGGPMVLDGKGALYVLGSSYIQRFEVAN